MSGDNKTLKMFNLVLQTKFSDEKSMNNYYNP